MKCDQLRGKIIAKHLDQNNKKFVLKNKLIIRMSERRNIL